MTTTYVSDRARAQALGSIDHLPVLLKAFVSPSTGDGGLPWFLPLRCPHDGDWLDEHAESGQSVAAFNQKKQVARPTLKRNKLLLVPVGTFPASALDVRSLAAVAAEFFSCPVILSKPLALGSLKTKFNVSKAAGAKSKASRFHRTGDEGQDQLHAGVILQELKGFRRDPRYAECFAVMGLTMVDLFPRDSWNFVYGLAFASAGAGIFSFARYRNEGTAWPTLAQASGPALESDECEIMPWRTGATDMEEERAALEQLLRVSCPTPPASVAQNMYKGFMRACARVLCHETCHLLGMRHCVFFTCLMNGSNHQDEACRRPLRLCPVCLRKLAHCLLPAASPARADSFTRDAMSARTLQSKRLPATQERGKGQLQRAQSTGSFRGTGRAGVAFGRSATVKSGVEREALRGAAGSDALGGVLLRRFVRLASVLAANGMTEEAEWIGARVAYALRDFRRAGVPLPVQLLKKQLDDSREEAAQHSSIARPDLVRTATPRTVAVHVRTTGRTAEAREKAAADVSASAGGPRVALRPCLDHMAMAERGEGGASGRCVAVLPFPVEGRAVAGKTDFL